MFKRKIVPSNQCGQQKTSFKWLHKKALKSVHPPLGSVSRSNRSISSTIDHFFFFFWKKGIVTRGRPFCSLVHPYKLIIGAFIKFTPIAFGSSQDLEGINYMNKTVLNAANPHWFMILLKVNCVFYHLNLFLSISQGEGKR